MPTACQALAEGDGVPAALTWRVQEFALRVWARFALVVVLPGFVATGVAAALHPAQAGRNWAAAIVGVLGTLMIVGLAQMGLLRYRADRTRRYLLEPVLRLALSDSRHMRLVILSAMTSG